jgi:hypothetical protein
MSELSHPIAYTYHGDRLVRGTYCFACAEGAARIDGSDAGDWQPDDAAEWRCCSCGTRLDGGDALRAELLPNGLIRVRDYASGLTGLWRIVGRGATLHVAHHGGDLGPITGAACAYHCAHKLATRQARV